MDGGRPERLGRCIDLEELGEIRRGKIVDVPECEKDLVIDVVFDGEPMALLQDSMGERNMVGLVDR